MNIEPKADWRFVGKSSVIALMAVMAFYGVLTLIAIVYAVSVGKAWTLP